jgi:orotidine-5'-phosphate decarboxylase
MQARDRLVVAADLSARDEILSLADEMHGIAGIIKLGLQAFIANGPSIVREIVDRDEDVFLDLKIHDIPNTARSAVAEAAGLEASMITVHAAGGAAMLRACAEVGGPLLLAVTVLTSLDQEELLGIGYSGTPFDNALRLAKLAHECGLRGVVASPLEIQAIRTACGEGFTILTPGIRPSGSDAGDQRRTMTPGEAIAAGADYIVVGRPITAAKNRREAALQILDEIAAASVK